MDSLIRQQALNPTQSFIVEAPAGSGKTELLVQRFLSLLANSCRFPEEILAITFTRKAAHEMRSRIIKALEKAKLNDISTMQSTTVELAKKVLQRDATENWQLLANPNRLRIQTIDALCMYLTQQMPIISGLGGQAHMAAHPEELYKQAAQSVLTLLDEEGPIQHALVTLFNHFDNQYETIASELVKMLKNRDQWLPYVVGINDETILRKQFETHLQRIQNDAQKNVNALIPKTVMNELLALAEYADKDLSTLLITQEGSYRKQVDKRIGFPADAKNNHKKIMLEILEKLQDHEDLRIALINLREAPPAQYTQANWEFLQALITILPILAAQLWLIFQQHKQIDFVEVSTRALQALGDEDYPTDLALVLDYQLQHILVDEFQDTSITQFRLIEKLTYHWQQGDGHTLFLVGDPMQSIYRFRQANVGLFLKAKFNGIGHIQLTPLQLSQNFRSHPVLIDWLNRAMPNIMPKSANISLGAIPFTACFATKQNDDSGTLKCLLADDLLSEAALVIEEIKILKQQHNDWQFAILVRARSHLLHILPLLKSENLAYHALEIEPLSTQAVIQDILALTFALLDYNDKLAWLALLRSPMCGLELAEIETLANFDDQKSIWQLMNEPLVLEILTANGRARVERLTRSLQPTIYQRARMPLARFVESAWLATGAQFYTLKQDNKNLEAFFQLLTDLESEYQHIDMHLINEHIAKLYTDELQSSDNPIQVMTIHKAKGLEFDAVFLPGLSRRSAANSPPLLRYIEQTLDTGTYWLLAPIHAKTAEHDPIYQYLGRLEKYQDVYETQRLLYVALTRAKYKLYLFAVQDPEKPNISSQSLYGLIAPALRAERGYPAELPSLNRNELQNKRIPLNWQMPNPWHDWLFNQPEITLTENEVDSTLFTPENIMRKHVGTLLHRILKHMAETGERVLDFKRAKIQLLELGVSSTQIEPAINILSQAVAGILNDPRGQWILQAHQEALCEHALHTHFKHKYTRIVIDRTFIFENERWIIDYKSGQENEDHTAQLQAYAHVMQKVDPRPIRLALYFPLTSTWKELV
jgi:ATP-dependent exoDNAse (exonuclease V) beta subunit